MRGWLSGLIDGQYIARRIGATQGTRSLPASEHKKYFHYTFTLTSLLQLVPACRLEPVLLIPYLTVFARAMLPDGTPSTILAGNYTIYIHDCTTYHTHELDVQALSPLH